MIYTVLFLTLSLVPWAAHGASQLVELSQDMVPILHDQSLLPPEALSHFYIPRKAAELFESVTQLDENIALAQVKCETRLSWPSENANSYGVESLGRFNPKDQSLLRAYFGSRNYEDQMTLAKLNFGPHLSEIDTLEKLFKKYGESLVDGKLEAKLTKIQNFAKMNYDIEVPNYLVAKGLLQERYDHNPLGLRDDVKGLFAVLPKDQIQWLEEDLRILPTITVKASPLRPVTPGSVVKNSDTQIVKYADPKGPKSYYSVTTSLNSQTPAKSNNSEESLLATRKFEWKRDGYTTSVKVDPKPLVPENFSSESGSLTSNDESTEKILSPQDLFKKALSSQVLEVTAQKNVANGHVGVQVSPESVDATGEFSSSKVGLTGTYQVKKSFEEKPAQFMKMRWTGQPLSGVLVEAEQNAQMEGDRFLDTTTYLKASRGPVSTEVQLNKGAYRYGIFKYELPVDNPVKIKHVSAQHSSDDETIVTIDSGGFFKKGVTASNIFRYDKTKMVEAFRWASEIEPERGPKLRTRVAFKTEGVDGPKTQQTDTAIELETPIKNHMWSAAMAFDASLIERDGDSAYKPQWKTTIIRAGKNVKASCYLGDSPGDLGLRTSCELNVNLGNQPSP